MAFLKHIKSLPELETLLTIKADSLVVIDFTADWCGPCHVIAPAFEQLSNQYRHATFAKVDVDAVPDVAAKYGVRAMPTFKFIKNKQVVETVVGADQNGLIKSVHQHAGPAPASASFTGEASASGSGASASKSDGPALGDISLLEFLDTVQSNCLNEVEKHSVKSILSSRVRNTSNAYLESDTDEQLLINIHFNQVVRVRSIVLHTKSASAGPKQIKLFTSKSSLGFEDVEDAQEPAASQVIELTEDTVKEGRHIPLRFVRFQNVNSLHIFVGSNQGGEDETRIDAIDILGVPTQASKSLSEAQKEQEEHSH